MFDSLRGEMDQLRVMVQGSAQQAPALAAVKNPAPNPVVKASGPNRARASSDSEDKASSCPGSIGSPSNWHTSIQWMGTGLASGPV